MVLERLGPRRLPILTSPMTITFTIDLSTDVQPTLQAPYLECDDLELLDRVAEPDGTILPLDAATIEGGAR